MIKKFLAPNCGLLVIILIIASFLRLYNLTPLIGSLPPGLYPDEAMNGNNALEVLVNHNWKVFYPENNGREGLLINIQSLLLAATGKVEPWILRLPSAIFGIFTVLGIYFLTKELFRPSEAGGQDPRKAWVWGLLAAFLLATSFWHINFSRIGFRAILAPFFLIWSCYFLLKAVNDGGWNKKTVFLSLAGGIFYGLGFYTYIAYRASPLLIFMLWWANRKKAASLKLTAFFALIAFLIALPIGIYFVKHPADFFGRTSQISIFSSPTALKDLGSNLLRTAGMLNFTGDGNWRHNIAGQPELFWPVGILFLIGFFLAVKSWLKEGGKAKPEIFIFTWLIIAGLPVIISNEGIPHALRSILLIPPVIILAAMGGLKSYEFLKDNLKITGKILNAGTIIFLSLLAFQAFYAYFITWGQNPNTIGSFNQDYVDIGRELNALPKALPKYVVVEAGGVLVRGLPMPAQTVMFITDTFRPESRKEKNITYLLPDQINQIPAKENHYIVYLK